MVRKVSEYSSYRLQMHKDPLFNAGKRLTFSFLI